MCKKDKEIAQLKARVAELEVVLKEMQRNGQKQGWNDHYESSMEKVENVLSRTPTQSLAEIQAQTLEKAEKEFRKMGYPRAADNLMVMARDIRQQAKGE